MEGIRDRVLLNIFISLFIILLLNIIWLSISVNNLVIRFRSSNIFNQRLEYFNIIQKYTSTLNIDRNKYTDVKSKKYQERNIDTLLLILQEQLKQLHQGIQQMDEDSLVKQVAKNKIIFNLNKKSNILELVYSYIALAQFYIINQVYEPAIKILTQSQEVKETGDASYLMGVCLFKNGKKNDSYKMFDTCLKQEWIEPSQTHQEANQLQSINYMQKIQYERAQKQPEKVKQFEEKLIQLCYQKIKIIKKFDSSKSQNYYYALAMADLAEVYYKFGQNQSAGQKIKTAIQMMKGEYLSSDKLIQFYYSSALIAERLNQVIECTSNLKNGIELIEQNKKKQPSKFTKLYEDIYYMYIKKTLEV